jgi:hypothetical protein
MVIEQLMQSFIFGGGPGGFVGTPILFLLRSFGTMTASRMQVLKTIAVSPWALKPFYGILSDCVYIHGFNKNPYIFFVTLAAIVSSLIIVFAWPISPVLLVILLFFMFLQIAFSDLIIEAKYITKTTKKSSISPDLVSFNDIISCLVLLLSVISAGLLIKYVPLHYIYLFPLPVFILVLFLTDWNWLEDEDYSVVNRVNRLKNLFFHSRYFWFNNEENVHSPNTKFPMIGYDLEKLQKNWRTFVMAIITGSISLLITCIGLLDVNTTVLFIISVIAAPIIIGCFFIFVDRRIAKIQSFCILRNMFAISIESAVFFFFTDTERQYPEGPHFSAFFYVTVMGIIAIIFVFIATILYNLFMTEWNYRSILLIFNGLYVFTSGFNIILFYRWNILIGIPDKAFVLGGEVLQVVAGQLSDLPLKVAMLQLCPPDTAATMYALLAGSSNLGNALAQYQGAFVLDMLDIKPTGAVGESRQFENMGIVGIIATVLPIIPLFFIRILIPDKGQKESLLLENEGEEEEDQIYSSDDSVTTTTTTEKEEKEEEKKKNKSKIQDICNYEMIELNTVK